jgi:hypothetical protein
VPPFPKIKDYFETWRLRDHMVGDGRIEFHDPSGAFKILKEQGDD